MSQGADSPSTDPSLLRMLGDPQIATQVWGEFLARYRPKIMGWCRQRGVQVADAEETCSRVIEKLLERFKTFRYDPARSFRGFLRTIVENTLNSDLRERRRKPGNWGWGGDLVPEPAEEIHWFADEIEADASKYMRVIERAVVTVEGQVKPETWACFWQCVYEGKSGLEVSRALGVPVAHVYIYKQRVLKRLRVEAAKIWQEIEKAENTQPTS